MEQQQSIRKHRVLCLHGFRTSASFLQKQISKWHSSVLQKLDMCFLDGIFPAGGPSEIEGIFPPPYYEWFQFNKDFTEYTNLDKCFTFLEDFMESLGPFDGLLGFSQGATLLAALAGLQMKGIILKKHPPIRFVVSISGSKFRDPGLCALAYSEPIKCRSVHLIGAKDWLKAPGEELLKAFESPVVIRHPQGHTVPRLDAEAIDLLNRFFDGLGRRKQRMDTFQRLLLNPSLKFSAKTWLQKGRYAEIVNSPPRRRTARLENVGQKYMVRCSTRYGRFWHSCHIDRKEFLNSDFTAHCTIKRSHLERGWRKRRYMKLLGGPASSTVFGTAYFCGL